MMLGAMKLWELAGCAPRAAAGGDQHRSALEIELPIGCRIRVTGAYEAEALALLIRRLSA